MQLPSSGIAIPAMMHSHIISSLKFFLSSDIDNVVNLLACTKGLSIKLQERCLDVSPACREVEGVNKLSRIFAPKLKYSTIAFIHKPS